MSRFGHAMLSPVLDLVQSLEDSVPYGDHTLVQKLWTTEARAALHGSLSASEATQEEQEEAYALLDVVSEGLSLFVEHASNTSWSAMSTEDRQALIQSLKTQPQIAQRSDEWFHQFGKVLTASEFAAVFTQTKRRLDLVRSKSHPPTELPAFRHACPTEELTPVGWGIRFEPVVKQILEFHDGCSIYEPGRLSHPTNTHLAASPDGIVEVSKDPAQLGRLIEIKCPYSRKIGGEIPSDYWIQMQIQLEVTGVGECDYVECDIVSTKPGMPVVDLSGTLYQGFVYLLKQEVPEGDPFEYRYVYGTIGTSVQPSFPEGFVCVETIPWGLKAWHRKLVQRDPVWYNGTRQWQDQFWSDVNHARIYGIQATPTKEHCLITDE